ncbi:TetR family transcriptional regulator [Streptosporangium sp. NBC_01755]|uniref:TetR family transcriptional regulator n=1 Tax=Streptosporangium sp. NBC_01755 TaxID=2975949 RepID=UPI002DD9B575|nr:TetR family transcriptional regulator [Streptosporangium sp. NBC_01755]WSD00406.1 TetR family transcriptional regulator [Streptosporangium sp. NBC_01755]
MTSGDGSRREPILRVATSLFAALGYDSASISQIAEAAGLSVELVAGLDLDALDDAAFGELAAAVGVDPGGSGQPEMAVVNAVLDALPADRREAVLIRFLSVIYS